MRPLCGRPLTSRHTNPLSRLQGAHIGLPGNASSALRAPLIQARHPPRAPPQGVLHIAQLLPVSKGDMLLRAVHAPPQVRHWPAWTP